MTKISIIIPLYNKAATIQRCIDSILNQTFQDWQVIVVDDGSTDKGPDIVKKFTDSRIEIVRQENQGPGAARNAGIRKAAGACIAFLDADDEWLPSHLQTLYQVFQENPQISFVRGMYYVWPDRVNMWPYWNKRGIGVGLYAIGGSEAPLLLEGLIKSNLIHVALTRKEVLLRWGGFYEAQKCPFGEDLLLWARMIFNEPFRVVEDATAIYHRENSMLTRRGDFPVLPMLSEPALLLDYCPPEKAALARCTLAIMALRVAHDKARNGYKQQARQLLALYPEMKQFKARYYKVHCEIAFSRWLPYWVRFKCFVGPPVRSFFKKVCHAPKG